MYNSCWDPFFRQSSDELRWAYEGYWENFQYVPFHVVAELQEKGPCCFFRWGPLQMAIASGCEVTVHLVLFALANSVSWGHVVPNKLRLVNLKVFELKHPWSTARYSPKHLTLVDRLRCGWKIYQLCPLDVQRVLVAGRKQERCVWSMLPKDLFLLILRMASEVVSQEQKDAKTW